MPQAEAAGFVDGWVVGRSYDGYWNPEHPSGVFFDKVEPGMYEVVKVF